MRDSDRRCWVRQPPQTVANPRVDMTAQHSLAAQSSHQISCHPSLHGVAATDRCPPGQHRCSGQADGWFHRGNLTPPQFIRAGVFMCRHIHRGGNGGPFLFRCTAGSTVTTCVHRMGHMAHSTQLTISTMHAHTKATESIILILSLGTGSRTPRPRPHTPTHAHDSSGCRHSEHTTHHPPAQPPHPHHQIHLQHSQQSSHTRTRSSSTRAQGPTRCRTVTIVIIARSGVAGVSQLISDTEGKQCNKRERDGAQRIQREIAENMRKRQQAQPHSSHTTRRQPPPSPPSSFPQPREMAKTPRPPRNAHGASTHHTRQKRKQSLIHP
ncbi:hypothetical protein TcG_12407 [Trypanosoma cruzi]|nr:hypothetical protein TcG_12407 [Trypanosoma cruzi]